jgi:hypothetical protein
MICRLLCAIAPLLRMSVSVLFLGADGKRVVKLAQSAPD